MRSTNLYVIILALAGLAPASAQVVVDHQPYNLGGTSSDLAFRDLFGALRWQRAADQFAVTEGSIVRTLNWWAFYRQDNPPPEESIQIRLYVSRAPDELPGPIVYEETITNPERIATGRLISIGGVPREFRFRADLTTPMVLEPGQLYWLEISQLNQTETWYLAEFSRSDTNGYAFVNDLVGDWQMSTASSDLAFQLLVPEPVTVLLVVAPVLAAGLRARGRIASG